MIVINDYFEFNNKDLFLILKKYIKENPCCKEFPNCKHPAYQSDSNLFNINNKDMNVIKDNYFNSLLKSLNKNLLNIINNKAWAYLTLKNENTQSEWHNHVIENNNHINISGLLYITKTNIGTEFKTKFLNFEIIPYTNRWFLWDSVIIHRPKNMLLKKIEL